MCFYLDATGKCKNPLLISKILNGYIYIGISSMQTEKKTHPDMNLYPSKFPSGLH